MNTTDETVQLNFEVGDSGGATRSIDKIGASVGKLGDRVDHLSGRFVEMVKGQALFAGMMNFGESIRGAKDYIEHVDTIHKMTGLAADKAAGISTALQESQLSAEEVVGVMGKLVKRGAKAEEGAKNMGAMTKRYGVDLKEGPQKALMKMSDLYAEHKIQAGQVGLITGLSGQKLGNFLEVMEKGGDELGRVMDDATKKNAFLGGEALDNMNALGAASARLHLAWQRITASIMVKFAPTVGKLVDKIADGLDSWLPKVEKFGSYLVDHMETIVELAKTYSKLMLANYAMKKVGGSGILGTAGKIGKFVRGGSLMAKMPFGGLLGKLGGLTGIGPMFAKLVSGAGILGKIGGSLLRLSVVSLIVAGIVGLFMKLRDAGSGAAARLGSMFGRIWESLKGIGGEIGKLFDGNSPVGKFFQWLGDAFLSTIEMIVGGVAKLIEMVRIFIRMVGDKKYWREGGFGLAMADIDIERRNELNEKLTPNLGAQMTKMMAGKGPVTDDQRRLFQKYAEQMKMVEGVTGVQDLHGTRSPEFDKMRMRFGAAIKDKPVPENQVYQDFRGSRFDITQAFAEGFDPGRVAVAFANDLGSIGERSLQSGFSPMFSVR